MLVQLQKTEQGLSIPIPEDLASKSSFNEDSVVEIRLENGKFVVASPDEPYYDIDAMIATITDENRHPEISTGRPRGNEVW